MDDGHSILKRLPRKSIDTIVFHRRLILDSHLFDPNATANFSSKCNILKSGKVTLYNVAGRDTRQALDIASTGVLLEPYVSPTFTKLLK
jgi:hypothetical protein